jgi:hypothetical protein
MITNIIMNKLIGPAAHLLNTIFYPSMSLQEEGNRQEGLGKVGLWQHLACTLVQHDARRWPRRKTSVALVVESERCLARTRRCRLVIVVFTRD